MTINEAVRAAMDEWKRGGTTNVDRMRELIDTLVDEAITEWQTDNVDATCDEEEEWTRMKYFVVEGVDTDDGSRTELAGFDNSGEARAFLQRYTSREDAGGWDLIEVYDTRGEEAERITYWERNDDDDDE